MRYSCARWIGLRVWNPTTRFQPRSAKIRRVSAGSRASSGNSGCGALEHGHAPREVQRLLRVQASDAGMRVVGRAEALLRLALLVVLEGLLDLEHGDGPAGLVREGDAVSRRRRVDGEADGKRPRKPAREVHLLDDALVVRLAHEALERRERARGDHVEVGELPRGERDDLERVEVGRRVAGAVDERPAVRRDQAIRRCDRHAVTLAGTSPSSSSFAMTCAADSSGERPSVSTTISALSGASYGSSTPVKPLISPANAFA